MASPHMSISPTVRSGRSTLLLIFRDPSLSRFGTIHLYFVPCESREGLLRGQMAQILTLMCSIMVLSQLGLLTPLLLTARASSYSRKYRELCQCFYPLDNADEAARVLSYDYEF